MLPLDEIEIADRSPGAADEEVLGRQLSLGGSSSNSPLLPSWLPKVAAAAADILPTA